MSVTAKQLAALLGISESAVSLALNNKPGVSTETRRRVIETAKAQGYDFARKSAILSSSRGDICMLIYKRSGAVIDDTPFFASLIDGVSIGCRQVHYNLVIRYVYEDEDISGQIYQLRPQQFDGIIILATEMQESDLHYFADIPVPFLFLDASFHVPIFNYVHIHNVHGAYSAASYLIRKRRTQPGYLRSNYSISNFEQRADGFYAAIRAAGLSTSHSPVHRLTPSQEGAYEDMKQLLAGGEKPANCYFADNDLIAIGVMEALREAGYRIPEDVAIVGFDDIPACEYTSTPLTTVSVPKQYMGEVAAHGIFRLIERSTAAPLDIQVFTKLIRRKSV